MNSRATKSATTNTWGLSSIFVSLGACVVLAVACSSSEEATPTRTITPAPVGNDSGASDASVAEVDPSCTSAGCFSCEPTALVDFLNACTEGQCAPFDNAARLPLYEPGKPLPPVP
ncbi:MAG TPA: hypothetical protein VM925_15840 [Labilithrix sp.]|nr:hypothetical protein [Labilithrix sp.]